MRALSIKQPWASLIALGIKDVENRTWRTHFRGRIYIHASAKDAGSLYQLLNERQLEQVNNVWTAAPPYPSRPNSAIIGEVDIVDCVLNHESIWAEHLTTYPCQETGMKIIAKGQKYVWNWVLANPILYKNPIENVKGKLSFWKVEPIIIKRNA